VQGEPAGGGGDPGREVDQLVADGGGSGGGVEYRGQGAGGAGQVVRDTGEGEPGGVGGEPAGWQVGQWPVLQVSNAAPSFLGAPWCAKIRRCRAGVWRVGGLGRTLVGFVVVDPESCVVPVSL
jgi:hypothetical protein